MKRFLLLIALCGSFSLFAQKDKEKVDFYTDSDVKRSIIGLGIRFDPAYVNRSILGDDPVSVTGSGFNTGNDKARGRFGYTLGADVYVKITSRLELGVGFGRSQAGFSQDLDRPDPALGLNLDSTASYDAATEVSTWNIPFVLNFRTEMNDLWLLEIAPMVEISLMDRLSTTFTPKSGGSEEERDLTSVAQSRMWNVGIALGGTYRFTNSFGLFVRGQFKYGLTPLISDGIRPREVVYGVGLTTGLKYYF